ncbi:hypothetical protein [Streptomyces sp. NPDC001975]
MLDVNLGIAPWPSQAVAPQLLDTAGDRARCPPPEASARAVRPEGIAHVIAFLVGDLAVRTSGAIVPAYAA